MSRPPRIHGFPYIGAYRYFLTFCTRQRKHIFIAGLVIAPVLQLFRQTATTEHFAIVAYCFMPDHVHLLVEGLRADSDMRRFVKLAKQRSGAAHAMTTGKRLWQEGYYDRVLRNEEDTLGVARYIFLNPVRAGLVTSPAAYPFLGSDLQPVESVMW